MVAFAAVVVLIVGGLLLGGGDDDRRSGGPADGRASSTTRDRSTSTTRRPATTTSSTSTTRVLGPILPGSSGAAVLVQSDSTGRWTWLDLGTGLLRGVNVPTDDAYSAVPVHGGVVVPRDGVAVYVPLPEGEDAELGAADQIVSAGMSDSVWLVRFGDASGGGAEPAARLVGLDGGVRATVVVPQLTYAMGATADGIVFMAGGRTYLARLDGVQQLGAGETLSVAGPFVALLTCDERADCAPEVIDTRTGRRRSARGTHQSHSAISALVSPTGALAVAQHDQERGLWVYDATGRLVGAGAGYFAELSVRWLPDGSGLVAGTQQLSIIRPDGGGGLIREPIQGVDIQADVILVIPR